MHRSEDRELALCADCGAQLRPGPDTTFSFGVSGVLCLECAVRRGGRYDGARDHWTEEPSLSGLEDAFD